MERVVVTGGAGFIGSLLCEKLLHLGYRVLCIDNMSYGYTDNIEHLLSQGNFQFINADVLADSFKDTLQENDIVFHCAAIAPLPVNQENPKLSLTNNVAGTANVLEACRIKGAKHVFLASTSAVYENNHTFPSSESDVVSPSLLYSLGKKFCEELCMSFFENYKLPYTILRFFNVYGPHHDCVRKNPPFIPYLVKSFLEGQQPLLHSNGEQRRDYIFIHDLLDFMVKLISNPRIGTGKIYNVCSGQTFSVEEIVQMTKDLMKSSIQPIYREPHLLWEKNTGLWQGHAPILKSVVEKEVTKYSEGSFDQAFRDYGWRPHVEFVDGLRITVESYIMKLRQNT